MSALLPIPVLPDPPLPQEPIFPRLPVSYYANYVQGRQSVTAITYNATTKVWTVTAAGSSLVSISGDADQTMLSINGNPALFIWNSTGMIGCAGLTNNVTLGKAPRLDFYRKGDSIPRKFASLSQLGLLSVPSINQLAAPSGTDRMYLLGNANVSIGLDGLVGEAGIYEYGLLQDQNGNYILDQSGLLVSAR